MLIILPIITFSQLTLQLISIVASWLFSHWKIMRKLWGNTRERIQGNEEKQGEDSSYTESIEVLVRETARKDYPVQEKVDNPMIATQDYDVRQSGRVLELHIYGYDPKIYPGTFLNTRDEAKNGAQTKRVRVLIGTVQIKRTRPPQAVTSLCLLAMRSST